MGTKFVTGSLWLLGVFNLFEWFFFLSENISPPLCWSVSWWMLEESPLQLPSTEFCLVLPNSQLNLPISGNLLGFPWIPFSALCPGISQDNELGQLQGSPHFLLFSQGSIFFIVWCPVPQKLWFHIFVHFFFHCFSCGGEFSPWYCILVRRRHLTGFISSHLSPIPYL